MSKPAAESIARRIARSLLDTGAVSLRADPPFTWTSGRKSPIYCDNRLLMSDPGRRREVAHAFAALFEKKGWQPEVIAGTATAGIPHAAWLADLLDLPMIYVRGQVKGHGKENRIEGRLEARQRVVLIEDLISTGGSSVSAAEAVAAAGGEIVGLAAIFTYGLAVSVQRFAEAQLDWAVLTSFDALIDEAQSVGALNADERAILSTWQREPARWSQARGGAG